MSDEQLPPVDPDNAPIEIRPDVAQPARVHNYLAGGDANFAVDRDVAEFLSGILSVDVDVDAARASARAQQAFLVRTVRYLVRQAGVRQFLNIGATIPTSDGIQQLAQEVAPESRVVHVSNDPVVLAHAHTLRQSTPQGATAYVHDSPRHPLRVLDEASRTLDLGRPVAIMLIGILNFVPDEHHPYEIVGQLLKGVPSGSYLVVAHATPGTDPELAREVAKVLSERLQRPFVNRTPAEVAQFFDGLELVEEGLVQIDQWHRHEHEPIPDSEAMIPIYGGVARKP